MKRRILRSFLRSRDGRERLWKIWWICGIPVAWLTSALVIAAEAARMAEHPIAGDWLDVLRILIYAAWARLAWQCAHNAESGIWTPVVRTALVAGFAVMYLV